MPRDPYESDDLLQGAEEPMTMSSSQEEIDRLRQHKQQQLIEIKRMQEQVEQEARELEEFTQRTRELTHGVADISQKLQRSLVILEHAEYESHRTTEEIRRTREAFRSHLTEVEQVEKIHWQSVDQKKDLTRALTVLDNASGDYHQAQVKLDVLSSGKYSEEADAEMGKDGDSFNFKHEVMQGLARNLALIATIFVAALIIAAALARSTP